MQTRSTFPRAEMLWQSRRVSASSRFLRMPLNIPGLLVPFQALFQPKILVPHLIVKGNPTRYLYLTVYGAKDMPKLRPPMPGLSGST